ncbi:uncharacterized protein A1O9_08124 [Exophiala aquamarina CBS 119918]|uniref:HD domain-containing protein n=1 Tax=Exophiala aquamarina CBS 119918 TaxID=1182545 RepID=A0A072P5L4_9EURO|nr:uncharacterized protein A1O9_08124 [Exophiala aquamarina CBS 119918]KEF55374.1 hypothetical protein A1O9_08124 [Exophiala aquamarina CBS 119918]
MSSKAPSPPLLNGTLSFPVIPLIRDALEHCKRVTSPTTVNSSIRSAYFAVLISQKLPKESEPLDVELIVYSAIMHDLGWAVDKSLLSKDKRFEVDSANMARTHLKENQLANNWDKHRIRLAWDAIALHTTPSFAQHKEPEVMLSSMGILADFQGPFISNDLITVDEYREVVRAFPRLGFKDQFLDIICVLSALKPGTTYDNFVNDFGCEFGTGGKGAGKEEFAKHRIASTFPHTLLSSLIATEKYDD